MTQALLALGVLLLLLPGWCEPRAQRVEARQRARAYRTSLSTGLVATLSGSLLWAAPIVLHLADRWGLPGLCDGVIHDLPLGGLELALGALTLGLVGFQACGAAPKRSPMPWRSGQISPVLAEFRNGWSGFTQLWTGSGDCTSRPRRGGRSGAGSKIWSSPRRRRTLRLAASGSCWDSAAPLASRCSWSRSAVRRCWSSGAAQPENRPRSDTDYYSTS